MNQRFASSSAYIVEPFGARKHLSDFVKSELPALPTGFERALVITPYRYKERLDVPNTLGFHPAERCLRRFSRDFPEGLRAMSALNMHPKQETPSRSPYLRLFSNDLAAALENRFHESRLAPQRFDNGGDHLLACGDAGSILATRIFEGDSVVRALIVTALLGHDLNKPIEVSGVALRKALAELSESTHAVDIALLKRFNRERGALGWTASNLIKAIDVSPYTLRAYERDAGFMHHLGTERKVANVATTSAQFTGHLSFKEFLRPLGDGYELKRGKELEAIVHFVDDITHSPLYLRGQKEPHCYLTPRDRMQLSNFIERYPFMLGSGIGTLENGLIVDLDDINNPPTGVTNCFSYMDLQPALSEAIAGWIVEAAGLDQDSTKTASQIVVDFINETANANAECSPALASRQ